MVMTTGCPQPLLTDTVRECRRVPEEMIFKP